MAKKMRAVQVPRPNAAFELVDRDIPEPGAGEVRVKVQACGLCHSDVLVRQGGFPGLQYPRVPGHEIAGLIDAVGQGVPPRWAVGQRVGIGWQGGYCGYCDACRRGEFFACQTATRVTGLTSDGGYADYTVAQWSALARLPDDLSPVEAGPLMCAGVTTFNALRRSGARAGDTVAVLGIGGLGHLGVQFAAKMGFRTIAIARGKEKESLARKLGASGYVDNQTTDPAEALTRMGGAKVILATVTSSDAMNAAFDGLAPDGSLLVVGADGALQLPPMMLIQGRRSVDGCYSGTSIDSEDTLRFSTLSGVRSMNEVFPLNRISDAYERMMSGRAQFRVVVTPE